MPNQTVAAAGGSSIAITTQYVTNVGSGYSCVFTPAGGNTNYTASATGTPPNLACTVPTSTISLPLAGGFSELAAVNLYYGSLLITPVIGPLTIFDCGGLTTCTSCQTQNTTYSCGWCASENSCTILTSCDGHTLPGGWSGSQCPVMETFSPSSVPVGISTTVTWAVGNLPDLDSTSGTLGTYYCDFLLNGVTTTTTSTSSVTISGVTSVVCPTPDYTPSTLAYGDHDFVHVDLRVSGDSKNFTALPATGNTTITLFNCTVKGLTCAGCLGQAYSCGWDSPNNVCRTNPTSGYPSLITSTGNCPTITNITPLYVSAGAVMNVTIVGTGFVTGMPYVCQYSNNMVTTGTFVSITQINCPIPLLYTGSSGIISGITLVVSYVGEGVIPSTASSNSLTFVSCSTFSANCFTCISAYSSYGHVCGWCTNSNFALDSCQYGSCSQGGSTFSQATCPNPTVTADVTPSSGPQAGGTLMTITGTNFIPQIVNITFTANNSLCQQVTYVSPTTLTCVTSAFSFSNGVALGNIYFNILSTAVPVALISVQTIGINPNPQIDSFSPTESLFSGGIIVIRGNHFVGGNSLSVTLGGTGSGSLVVDCAGPGTSINTTTMVCITPPVASTFSGNITVKIDGAVYSTSDVYTYSVNPTVTSFYPIQGPIGGQLTVAITGENLDVLAPAIPTCTVYGLPCIVIGSPGSTTMDIQLPVLPFDAISIDVGGGVFYPIILTYGENDPFTVTMSSFQFFGDPFIAYFYPSSGPIDGNTTIVILGTNFIGTPIVTIGNISCTVIGLSFSEVDCVTDPSPSNMTGNLVLALGMVNTTGGPYTYVNPSTITTTTAATSTMTGTSGGSTATVTTTMTTVSIVTTTATVTHTTTATATVTNTASVATQTPSIVTVGGGTVTVGGGTITVAAATVTATTTVTSSSVSAQEIESTVSTALTIALPIVLVIPVFAAVIGVIFIQRASAAAATASKVAPRVKF